MKKEKIFWGLFFIVGAFFMIISKLGFLPDLNVFSLFITIFFGACFIKSIVHLEFWGIFFSLAFLGIIYAKPLQITEITPWPILGAALLLSIGFSMLFQRHTHCYSCHHHPHDKEYDSVDQVNGNRVEFSTSFGSSIKYVNSDNFERADLDCSFGAMKVYFDNAIIQSGNAVIDMRVSFSGVELYIPKSWHVVDKMDASFAGVEEKNKNEGATSPTVTLTGSASFGGVTILYI